MLVAVKGELQPLRCVLPMGELQPRRRGLDACFSPTSCSWEAPRRGHAATAGPHSRRRSGRRGAVAGHPPPHQEGRGERERERERGRGGRERSERQAAIFFFEKKRYNQRWLEC